jgi:2-haloalkanoic acid dehalogenase type II
VSIRAVFFDLGGTLFSYGSLRDVFRDSLAELAERHALETSPRELRQAYQVSVMSVMAEYRDRPYYLHRELFADAHARLLERLGVPAEAGVGDPAALGPEGAGLERVAPREGTRETLERLRAAGLQLSIVSNIDDDQFEAVWGRIGLADCFDAVTTSEQARSCKPHPRIFDVALEKAGLAGRAAAVAFVGDSLHHDVAGANAAGMRSIWLSSEAPAADLPHAPDHVIRDLRELPELLLP